MKLSFSFSLLLVAISQAGVLAAPMAPVSKNPNRIKISTGCREALLAVEGDLSALRTDLKHIEGPSYFPKGTAGQIATGAIIHLQGEILYSWYSSIPTKDGITEMNSYFARLLSNIGSVGPGPDNHELKALELATLIQKMAALANVAHSKAQSIFAKCQTPVTAPQPPPSRDFKF